MYIERASASNGGEIDTVDENDDGIPDNNTVMIEFELDREIPELETFSFSINNLRNPPSTSPTDPIIVQIYSDNTLETVTSQDEGQLIVITNVAYDLPVGTYSLN